MSITYFPMYPSDWLAGTRGLSDAETGVYITLICRMYEMAGPIERDDERLMRICGCKSKSAFVKSLDYLIDQGKIEYKNGQLLNERVQKELKKLVEKSEKAKKAINQRWANKSRKNKGQGDTDVSLEYIPQSYSGDTNQNQNHNQSITTNSTSKKTQPCAPSNGSNTSTDPKSKYDEQFEMWWKMYPNKQGKADAQKKFRKMTDDQIDNLFAATRHYIQAISHGVNSGLACHGSTFINGRYLDWIANPSDELLNVSTPIEAQPRQAGDRLIQQLEEQANPFAELFGNNQPQTIESPQNVKRLN